MRYRIGINLGDVIHDETRIYGHGINIAARLEALAQPGGVLASNTVYDQVRRTLPFTFEDLGERQVKNIEQPCECINSTSRASPPRPCPRSADTSPSQPAGAGSCGALFEDALRIDPDNSQARVGLTQALTLIYRNRWDPEPA